MSEFTIILYPWLTLLSKFNITIACASIPSCFSRVTTNSSSSIVLVKKNHSHILGFLYGLTYIKGTLLIIKFEFHLSFSMSTKSLPVSRKGLTNMIETLQSNSPSRITKLVGNINDTTFTNISHKRPTCLFTAQSTIKTLKKVDFDDPNPNYL